MIQAWYMANCDGNQRDELHLDPPCYLTLDEVQAASGVEYFKIDVDNLDTECTLKKLKQDRGYNYEDRLEISSTTLPNYEEKLKIFFKEHLHADEEIRLFVDGSGYFDVRDKDDKWIRIHAGKGDLLILPAGIYHRFTPDKKDYAKVVRLFCGEPVWTAINRPADDHPARQEYLDLAANGFQIKCH